jgi:hypothetical protein
MKRFQAAVFVMMLLVSVPAFAHLDISCAPENESNYEGVDCAACHGPGANWDVLCGAFNPAEAIRIEYEKPRGCDEVSGTIEIKAAVLGTGAPVPASMKYELRTSPDDAPVAVLSGPPPGYEVSFDTTTVRNGFVALTAIPLDDKGSTIAVRGPGIIPPYRGFMVNNGIDVSRPLIVIGAPLNPYPGPFAGWTAEELKGNLTLALNLTDHLRRLGFIPASCFTDTMAVVVDPDDPLNENPGAVVDLMGESVAGTPVLNPGTLCLAPFYEIPGPNGLDDMVENTAWANLQLIAGLGVEDQNATPQVSEFYARVVDRLTYSYRHAGDWYSTFEYKEPVRGEEPIFRLKEKLEHTIRTRGITSVLVYGDYHRSSDFEMSADAWPEFQEAVDEINQERGTSVEIGSITNNDYLLMDYEGFLRSQYLTAWSLVKAAEIPAGKKVGIISAGHGSSKTTRLYDVSRFHNPVLKQLIEEFVKQRIASIYAADTPFTVCYSEYANNPSDGLRGVGEQVWQWVNEGYDYILVCPMEWPWGSTEVWDGLHKSAVELVDPDNTEILELDEWNRSQTLLNGKTRLIIGESIFEQQEYNPAPYHYFLMSHVQLLEDRMMDLTNKERPGSVSGTLSITGGDVTIARSFDDTLAASRGRITLQTAGIQARGITLGSLVAGVLNKKDMANYLFAMLAENSLKVEDVQVTRGILMVRQTGSAAQGSVTARATATIDGEPVPLTIKIELQ